MKQLPIDQLYSLLDLDKSTGRLYWKVRVSPVAGRGDEAGTLGKAGYKVIQIKGRLYYAHRIIFAMINGRWPLDMIDHANLDRSDNRPENLRESDRAENMRNRERPSNNTSGIKGVSWCKRIGKWQAYIKAGGKREHLGFHDDLELAELIVSEARRVRHGMFAHA